MTDLVERVAISIYASDGFLLAMYSDPAESWRNDREGVRRDYRRRAKAAIAAMREPTERMCRAAFIYVDDDTAAFIWRSMHGGIEPRISPPNDLEPK